MASDTASHSRTTDSLATPLMKPEKFSTLLFQTLAERIECLSNKVTHSQCVFVSLLPSLFRPLLKCVAACSYLNTRITQVQQGTRSYGGTHSEFFFQQCM